MSEVKGAFFAHQLHRASQIADAYFVAAAPQLTVTPRQLVVLKLIEENPGCSQTDLVDNSGIDRSTLAEIVKRLARSGNVKRRRSKLDARAYELALTDQGRTTLIAGLKAALRSEATLTRALGDRAEQLQEALILIASLPVPSTLPDS